MQRGMTLSQHRVLVFLRDYIAVHGIAPTLEEIRAGTERKSRSQVHYLLLELEQRGRIRRVKNRERSIELVGTTPIYLAPEIERDVHVAAAAAGLTPADFIGRMFKSCSVSRETFTAGIPPSLDATQYKPNEGGLLPQRGSQADSKTIGEAA